MSARPKIVGELRERVLRDLETREKLRQEAAQYTYYAIAKRHGLHHNSVWGLAAREGFANTREFE